MTLPFRCDYFFFLFQLCSVLQIEDATRSVLGYTYMVSQFLLIYGFLCLL